MKKHLAFAVILLLWSQPGWAVDRYVPSQYATIQAAVDAAQGG